MRVSIAACVLVLGVAAAFADEFRIVELATYSGTLPCADCVGIRYVLSLCPDGRFYRQRTYLRSENSGETVLDAGAWSATWSGNASVLNLTSTTQDREAFTVSSANSLLLLDRESDRAACAGQPEANCTLTREPRAYAPQGLYRIRGIYREAGGRQTLQPCGSRTPLPAATSGQPLLLQRLSKAAAGGKPALVTVTALFDNAGNPGGGETLRIANVLTAQPGGACPAAVRVPPMVAGLRPPSANEVQPQAGLLARLAGTSWVLTEIDRAAPPAGIGEGEASLRFLQEGRVSGFTGCNRFNGPYTLAGRSVHFGLMVTTRMACPVSANIEVPYMKALEDARQIDLQDDSFYLVNAAGGRIARFRAVHRQ
jgi:copper homeostasis protein (lipoprotein)